VLVHQEQTLRPRGVSAPGGWAADAAGRSGDPEAAPVHHEQTLKDERVSGKHAQRLGRQAAKDVPVASRTEAREPFHRSQELAQRKKAEEFFHRARESAQRCNRHSAPAAVDVTTAAETKQTARYYASSTSMRPGSAVGPGRYCYPRHPRRKTPSIP